MPPQYEAKSIFYGMPPSKKETLESKALASAEKIYAQYTDGRIKLEEITKVFQYIREAGLNPENIEHYKLVLEKLEHLMSSDSSNKSRYYDPFESD